MTSILVAAAGIVALVGGSVGTRWLVHWWHQENHAQHAAGAVVPARLPERDFYGSMTLAGEHELPPVAGYLRGLDAAFGRVTSTGVPRCSDPPEESCSDTACPVHGWDNHDDAPWSVIEDPVPWEDLQSGARIEDDRDGTATAAWFHGLGEDPGPGVDRPPPPGPVQAAPGGVVPAADWPFSAGTPARGVEPTRLATAAEVDAARPWLDVQLEDLYVWVRGVLAA